MANVKLTSGITGTVTAPGNTDAIPITDNSGAAVLKKITWSSLIAKVIPHNTVTAKGDIIAATGSAAVDNLAVGSDYKALIALSGETTGLAYAPACTYLDYSTTVTEFTNDDTEKTLYTKSITQSLYTSTTNRVLLFEAQCQLYNNKGAATIQYSYKFKYGNVSLTVGAFSQSSAANAYYDVVIRAWVMGNGATNAQIIAGDSCFYWGGSPTLYSPATTTGTVDSTAAVTVALTCTMNTADANGKNRMLFGGISTRYP